MKRILCLMLFATGCSHVHSVHQDTIEATPGQRVEVMGQKRVWFNFNFDNSFIDETYEKLVAKCPGGRIHSVSSRLSSENGVFFWFSRVKFAGVCVKEERVATTSRAAPGASGSPTPLLSARSPYKPFLHSRR